MILLCLKTINRECHFFDIPPRYVVRDNEAMKHILIICFLTVQGIIPALAQSDSEMGFDEIVNDLSRSRSSAKGLKSFSDDPFDEIKIHVGLGVTNGVFAVQHSDGTNTQANQRGVQFNL